MTKLLSRFAGRLKGACRPSPVIAQDNSGSSENCSSKLLSAQVFSQCDPLLLLWAGKMTTRTNHLRERWIHRYPFSFRQMLLVFRSRRFWQFSHHPISRSRAITRSPITFRNSITSSGHSGQLCIQQTIPSHPSSGCMCRRKFLLSYSSS